MKKIKIGILGPSEIAFRRFLPALRSSIDFEYVGVAIADDSEWSTSLNINEYNNILAKEKEKADRFVQTFGGEVFYGYEAFMHSNKADAVYVPLPPSLHFKWAKLALRYGKHVMLEKPFTTNRKDTTELIAIATNSRLALHENYAFCFHNQIEVIRKMIEEGKIGELRQVRAAFGFPYRGANDFRYQRELGGGALLDCGGYPVKLASLLLGKSTQVVAASLIEARDHDVDVFGSVTLMNDDKITAQLAFGMDNFYKCELEVWGSEGCLLAPRIFTPPANFKPNIIFKAKEEKEILVAEDDQFLKSINYFKECIDNEKTRTESYDEILNQSRLIEDIRFFKIK